ncbi:trypsin-like serine protease [Streptomyces sp. NPDC004237]|uniref:S1 family peptidase n=1 Tax=Streptomyces sp. NPDC004237 TaxID=3154455 RepID=UPI0033AEC616
MLKLARSARPAAIVLVVGLVAGGSSTTVGTTPAGVASGSAASRTDPVVALVNASSPAGNLFNGQFCGGVLVAADLVLTAAHCVRERRHGSVDAVVGADNLCRDAPVQGRRLHVRSVILHPRTGDGPAVDAALLVLAGTVGTDPARVPAPGGRSPSTGTVFGWGRNGYGGVAPCRRTPVPLRFVPVDRCVRAQRNLDVVPNPDWQSCAVPGKSATRNTCTGDSGSPLIADTGPATVLAIVSWGPSCRVHDVGVYVRASALRSWIAGYRDPQERPR